MLPLLLLVRLQGAWSHCLTELSLRWEYEEDGADGGSSSVLKPPLCYPVMRSLQLNGVTLSVAQLGGFFSAACFPQLTDLDVSGCTATALPHTGDDQAGEEAVLVRFRRLCLPTIGSLLPSGDRFCEWLLSPAVLSHPAERIAVGLLRELRIRSSMSGASLDLLCSSFRCVELLDLSGSHFECCYWLAHMADSLRRPATGAPFASDSSNSCATPTGSAIEPVACHPFRPLSLRLLDWSSCLTPCSCGSRYGPVPDNAGLEDEVLLDGDRAILRRRKERDAALSEVNSRALQTVLARFMDTLTSLSFQFSSTCQWNENVSPALRSLTGLRTLVVSFPYMYGDEEDPIEPMDDIVSTHWPCHGTVGAFVSLGRPATLQLSLWRCSDERALTVHAQSPLRVAARSPER